MDGIATLKGLKCPHCGCERLTVTGTKGALGASIATGLAFGAVGNLVAGSNAAANQVTGPLQYQCEGCKNKFETLPLIAPPEDVLETPCTVTFTREKNFMGAAVPQIVYINGIKLGAVKNGKSITFATSSRYNVMFVTDQYGVAFKSEHRFEAQPGGNVWVRFNRRFLQAQDAPANDACAAEAAPSVETASAGERPKVRFCTNCGASLGDNEDFCSICGTKRFPSQPEYGNVPMSNPPVKQALPEKPERSLWLSGILALSWVTLLLFQGIFGGRLLFSSNAAYFIVAALMGAGVYQLMQKGTKYKLYGMLSGLVSAFLYAGSSLAVLLSSRMVGKFSITQVMGFGEPYYWPLLGRALLFLVLIFGASALAGYLLRKKPQKQRLTGSGAAAAVVYALCTLVAWFLQYGWYSLGNINAAGLFSILFGMAADAAVLYLAVRFTQSLCSAPQGRVQLFGAGKVWAWIAAVAMFLSIGIVIGTAYGSFGGIAYTSGLLLAVAGMTGYLLLLCHRRIGLYVIVGAAALALGAQFAESLIGMMYSASRYISVLFASIFGAVNPLLGWLAVRAADRRGSAPPVRTAPSVRQNVSGFQKFASIFNIVIGGLLIIPPIANMSDTRPEAGFILTFLLISAIYLIFGIWCTASRRSAVKPYPKWMKIISIILFSVGALMLVISMIGILSTL